MPIRLEVVTVERPIFDDDVDMIIAPGSEGVLGILPRHAPLLTALTYGELVIRKQGEDDQLLAIGGGFMEVQPDKVTVLADVAEHEDEINLERAEAARDRAKNMLETGDLSPTELARAEAAMKRALIRLKVAQKRSRRRSTPQ